MRGFLLGVAPLALPFVGDTLHPREHATGEMLMADIDDNTVIWRYMRFDRFVSILETSHLWFTRAFKFDDRWEGYCPPSYVRNTRRYAESHGPAFDEWEADFVKRRQKRRYAHFVNCWHIGEHESDAMWRLYGLSPQGIALQSTVGCFNEHVRPHSSGAVIYYDPRDDIRHKTMFGPNDILYKRDCFSWEREYRFWFYDDAILDKIELGEAISEEQLTHGELRSIGKMEDIIKRVVIAPSANDSFVAKVMAALAEHSKRWLGSRVERSYSDRSWESFCK